jgi:hypothetical protein
MANAPCPHCGGNPSWWLTRNGRPYWPVPVVVIVIVILLMGWTPADLLQLVSLLRGGR